MPRLKKEIAFGARKIEALINPDCAICTAKGPDGTDLRPSIDKYLIDHNYSQTERFCKEIGFYITDGSLRNHVIRHSPYILDFKKELKLKVQEALTSQAISFGEIADKFLDAEDVIQTVINIGGHKVRSGEIEVTDKLLIAALNEQGKRKTASGIEEALRDLDGKKFVEGQIIEEEKKEEVVGKEETLKLIGSND